MRVCINLLTPGSICFYSKNVGSDLIVMTNENMDKEHMNDTNNILYVSYTPLTTDSIYFRSCITQKYI